MLKPVQLASALRRKPTWLVAQAGAGWRRLLGTSQKEVNMAGPTNNPIEILVRELQFLDSGVYSPRREGGSFRIFQDSPSCPNFHRRVSERVQCDECPLIQFVPPEDRDEVRPCQFIQLNEQKETPEMLFYWGTAREQRVKLRDWLLCEIFRRTRTAHNNTSSIPIDAT